MASYFDAVEQERKLSKEELERLLPDLRVELLNAQFELRSRAFPLIIVLAGSDRLGVAELCDDLNEWLDARRLDTRVFEAPTQEESERPRFWRYWCSLPRRGEGVLLVGEWTWRAIVQRTLRRISKGQLARRLEHVRAFERALVADGACLVKLWLHAPERVLEERREAHEQGKRGSWRFDSTDRLVLEHYDRGLDAAEEVLRATDAPHAPWTLIASADREHRGLRAATSLLAALRRRLDGSCAPPVDGSQERVHAPDVRLDALDLSSQLDKQRYSERLAALQAELYDLSRGAFESGRTAVLVFEGQDAAGKGGAIRRLTRAMNAARYRVVPIGAPSEEERAHHYLWRFWQRLPRAGRMLIFDRSWYGRVLVERVEGFASEDEWRRAFAEIVDFEEQLVEHDVLLLKFWLQIDEAEQERRFRAREQTPYKKYKIGAEDYRNRAKWPQYRLAADEAFQRTSTPAAPWHLIAANDKRWARIRVLETLCERLRARL